MTYINKPARRQSEIEAPTTTALQPPARRSALAAMAARFDMEPAALMKTLKDTVFQGASDSECAALVVVSNEYGLNPFTREIYAFPKKGGGIVPVVSVDGWIKLGNRADLDGLEFEFEWREDGLPDSCTVSIWVKGRNRPVRVTEFYSECFRSTDPWRTMPRRMLRHKALIQGLRVAFGYGGIQDEDEARDIAVTVEPIPDFSLGESKAEPKAEPKPKLKPAPKEAKAESEPEPEPQPEAPAEQEAKPAAEQGERLQVQLAKAINEAGFEFSEFQEWGVRSGNFDPEDVRSWADVPDEQAAKFLKSIEGVIKGLARIKKEGGR